MSAVVLRLVELANLAKKALTFAQADCSQANDLILESERLRDNAMRQYPRLVFLNKEILRQVQVLTILITKVVNHRDDVFREYEEFEKEISRIYTDLDNVFLLLKEKTVASELQNEAKLLLRGGKVGPAPSSPSAAATPVGVVVLPNLSPSELTLYEFIDTESINQLKLQTNAGMMLLKELYTTSKAVCLSLQEKTLSFADSLRAAGSVVDLSDTWLVFFDDALREQNEISEIMANSLLAIGDCYERCVEALKISREHPGASVDLRNIESQANQLPTTIDGIEAQLQRFLSSSNEIKAKAQLLSEAIAEHTRIFKQIDMFSATLRAGLTDIKSAENEFYKKKPVIQGYREEFLNLVAWYDLFYDAYDRLILEIDRRYGVYRQQRALVDRFITTLREMNTEETRKRTLFDELHGQYLPPALNAFLQEPLPPLRVVPENFTCQLPMLTEETVSLARERTNEESLSRQGSTITATSTAMSTGKPAN